MAYKFMDNKSTGEFLMLSSRRISLIIATVLLTQIVPASASHVPVNLVIPYDRFVTPPYAPHYRIQLDAYGEWGMKPAHALNKNGNSTNPLQIWNGMQDMIAMLEGAPEGSPIAALRNKIGPIDDPNSGK